MRTKLITGLLFVCISHVAHGQQLPTPVRQAVFTERTNRQPISLHDASRNDRWLGLGVRDIRWAPDGSVVYFRWNTEPKPNDIAEADPWYRADPNGRWVERVADLADERVIPEANLRWSPNGARGVWSSGSTVFLYREAQTQAIVTLGGTIQSARFHGDDAVDISTGGVLYRYTITDGSITLLAAQHTIDPANETVESEWLARQQRDLFAHVRNQDARRNAIATIARRAIHPQAIPVAAGQRLENIQASPDGQTLTFRVRNPATNRPNTDYIDYVSESGYATVQSARAKTGEPRDVVTLGIVRIDPAVLPDSVRVTSVTLPEALDQHTVPHGPYWSPDGQRAIVQFIGEDHKDVWYAELDVTTGTTHVVAHDHDDGWIGGPTVQANYLQPALLEWLPDGSWVFASERTGWSHLYRLDPAGEISALTSGDWEVRNATLSRDRSTWLLQTSREHPADDHLYHMPATGGELVRITQGVGRNEGWQSPDGRRLAVLHSTTTELPDLFTGRVGSGDLQQVTVSGTEEFFARTLVTPSIVSFPHPDGDPIWAALYRPDTPHPDRPAVIHVHGGGYRQFAHRGWSVYGWALHVGFLSYLVEQGYTVLDFDYRGGAGFGRDYRTDVARSMGIKDADGVAAGAQYLASEHGIDPTRIGMHGVSYGGFLTLMTLFRHPGVVTAGIARASVTDWAHYSDGWTSRILGVPHEDEAAYERSSPIYYADGLEDHLLLTHGLLDDNVHFQDAARLVQKLIELEKDFDVMYYPVEPHTIQTEASRYDFLRRAAAFFEQHLIGPR